MTAEPDKPVRAKWVLCSCCASTYVLALIDYEGDLLCYLCIVEGARLDADDRA